MKAKYLIFSACIALLSVACSKDPFVEIAEESRVHSLSIEGVLPELDSEDTRATASSVIRLEWHEGDEVSVVNLTKNRVLAGSLYAQTSGQVTEFKGDVTGTISQGDKLALIYPSQHYTTEKAFQAIHINMDAQGGSSHVPVYVYSTVEYSPANGYTLLTKFKYMTAYVRMNLGNLTAGETLHQVMITGVSNSMDLTISGGELVATPNEGSIVLAPNTTTGSNLAQTVFFTMPASSDATERKVYVHQDNSTLVADWSTANLRAEGLYNTTVVNFTAVDNVSEDSPFEKTNIVFEDSRVKNHCVQYWDTDHDGELSLAEAAAVTNDELRLHKFPMEITAFDEFRYFTGITMIPLKMFECSYPYSSNLRHIVIPEGVTTIGHEAFRECRNLESVTLPSTLVTIEYWAFEYCALKSIEIPEGVTTIGSDAFINNKALTTVSIPSSLTNVGSNIFNSCDNLEQFYGSGATPDHCGWILGTKLVSVLPKGLVKQGITEYIVPEGVTEIGTSALSYCKNLTNIILPSSLRTIDSYAFSSCENVTNLVIPEGVTTFGECICYDMPNLERVYLPQTLQSIRTDWFMSCNKLVYLDGKCASDDHTYLYDGNTLLFVAPGISGSFTIPENLTVIGDGAFYNSGRLGEVSVPPTVTTIGANAFSYSNIYKINLYIDETLTSALTTIGSLAFSGTQIHKIVIPPSVTELGGGLFENCQFLKTIYMGPLIPPYTDDDGNMFEYVGSEFEETFTIKVFNKAAYLADEYWCEFGPDGSYGDGYTAGIDHYQQIAIEDLSWSDLYEIQTEDIYPEIRW